MNQLATLTGVLLLATLTEALVEYLAKPWLRLAIGDVDPEDHKTLAAVDLITGYTATAVGVLLCLAYGADLLQSVGLWCRWDWLGPVVTGILAGRGANFVHDFAGRWLRT
jgi:type IV secretory pathway VirB2 component (pilin)